MPQRLDRFLRRNHGAANGAVAAFGQTGLGAGGFHSGIRYDGVGDHVRVVVILRIAAKAAGVDGIALCGTGRHYDLASHPIVSQHLNRGGAENCTAVVAGHGNGACRSAGSVNGGGCGVRMLTGSKIGSIVSSAGGALHIQLRQEHSGAGGGSIGGESGAAYIIQEAAVSTGTVLDGSVIARD